MFPEMWWTFVQKKVNMKKHNIFIEDSTYKYIFF